MINAVSLSLMRFKLHVFHDVFDNKLSKNLLVQDNVSENHQERQVQQEMRYLMALGKTESDRRLFGVLTHADEIPKLETENIAFRKES